MGSGAMRRELPVVQLSYRNTVYDLSRFIS